MPDEVDEQKPLTAMWAEFGGLMALFDRRVDEVSIVCMSERGFEYRPPDRGEWLGWVTPRGYFDHLPVERARELGYVVEEPDIPMESPAVRSASESEQRAFWIALLGTDEERVSLDNGMDVGVGGCLGEARAAVAGSGKESVMWLSFSGHLNELRNEAWEKAEASPDWRRIETAWTECMNEQGYEVDDPSEAVDLALDGPDRLPFARPGDARPVSDEERPTEWEIQVAVADAECREDTSLDTEWERIVAYFEQEIAADNPEVIIAWHETAERMRQVLADQLAAAPNPEDDPGDDYVVPTRP